MTRSVSCILHPLCIVSLVGCISSSEPKQGQASPASSESSNTPEATTPGLTTGSGSSSVTSPSSTSQTLHDSAGRPSTPGDTGRPDSGWFTLPGPGFDSVTNTTLNDTQDTG